MLDEGELEAILSEAGDRILQGDLQGARLLLEGALQRTGDEPRIKSLLAHVYSRLEMHTEALHIYDQLIRLFPKEGSLYFRKGVELLHLGDIPEGLAMVQKATRLAPQETQWSTFFRRVRALLGFETTDAPTAILPEDLEAVLRKIEAMQRSSGSRGEMVQEEGRVTWKTLDGTVVRMPVALKKGIYVAPEYLLAGDGDLRILPSGEEDHPNLLRVMGEGTVLVATDRDSTAVEMELKESRAFVVPSLLMAFQAGLSWERGALQNSTDSLQLLSFRGTGTLHMAVPGSVEPLAPHGSKHQLVVPSSRIVAWYGPLLAQFSDDSFVYFSGTGTVLVRR